MSFLPFARPDITQLEIDAVVDTLRSGWVTTGPVTKEFESDFSRYIGGGVECVAVNSATAGLHLALEAMGVGPEDEVILPTYTFTSTAEVVRYLGATPVFVDVKLETYNIDISSVKRALSKKTKVIIAVHFAGLSCEMDEIIQLARDNEIYVLEDAAHALPTTYRGQLIGSLESDATVFSFYANKTITTGEGGMVVSRNQEIVDRCRVMRLHGISRDAFSRYTSNTPSWFYEVIAPGYKYNLTDISAALGRIQLRRLPDFHKIRINLANNYYTMLDGLPVVLPPKPLLNDIHAWHLFSIRLKNESGDILGRDEFIEKMAREGVGCSVHFIPLHSHPYWKESYNLKPDFFPNATALYESQVSLPLYTMMTIEDQEKVVYSMRKVLGYD